MAKAADLPYPPHWINAYIFAKLSEYEDIGIAVGQEIIPIFAISPVSIDDVYKQLTQTVNVENPLLIQYDRMIKLRPSTLYPHKREQALYYIYSTALANVNNATTIISQLLDREDAAAQDVNSWVSKNKDKFTITPNVFFHNIKVYQTDEARSLMSSVSVRTMYVAKVIIEYDFHAKDGSTFR